MELRAQSDILTAINTRGHRRQHIEWVILLVVLFVAALLIYVFG
jgi:putative copper export protein